MRETAMTGERLHRDVHPAEVLVPDGTLHSSVRVFITDQRIQVWADRTGGPAVVYESPITTAPERDRGSLFGQIHVETPAGMVHVSKAKGCGCHSPLKALPQPASW